MKKKKKIKKKQKKNKKKLCLLVPCSTNRAHELTSVLSILLEFTSWEIKFIPSIWFNKLFYCHCDLTEVETSK